MNLAALIAARDAPGECIRVPFPARLAGRSVEVTAVLNRTAVYHCGDICNKQLAPLADLSPLADLQWIPEPDNSLRRSAARGRAMGQKAIAEIGWSATRWKRR